MFALANIQSFERVSLKVLPEEGVEIRERHQSVTPAYHMNKRHWITVRMDGTIPDRLLREWLVNSYDLVVKGLTKKQKSALESL